MHAQRHHHHHLLLLAVAAAAAASGTAFAKPTAYEVLADYDFPPGILPKGVASYTLDNATGAFTATLDSVCEFSIQGSYSLRYKTKISGTIATDKLTDLEGVSVKVLLFWLNIVEVTRSGDNLDFSVGLVSAEFGVDSFLESPTCGCGFDCDDVLMLQNPGAATANLLRLRVPVFEEVEIGDQVSTKKATHVETSSNPATEGADPQQACLEPCWVSVIEEDSSDSE